MENRFATAVPGPSAGVKKNALNAWAVRRSSVGMRAMLPLTLVSAEARADGLAVSMAAARSTAGSRWRDRARMRRKLTAWTRAETAVTARKTAAVFWSRWLRPPNSWEQ